MGLNIVIVGAGLAGLAAASFLRKHHTVTLLEQSYLDFNCNDYGLSIISNAFNLLQRVGVREDALDMLTMTKVWQRTSQNDEIMTVDFDTRKTMGAPSVLIRRAVLQAELYRLATSIELEGMPAKVLQGLRIESINADIGSVKTSTGTIFTGDLLIGADGINSIARAAVLSLEACSDQVAPATSQDLLAYMAQIPVSILRDSTPLSFFAEPETSAGLVTWIKSPSEKHRILAYHTPPETVQLVGYASQDEFAQQFEGQGNNILRGVPASRAKKAFVDFAPGVTCLFDNHRTGDATVEVWRIRDLDLLPHWYRGRTLLVGDSCHAVTPHAGQGANLAIEDAEALGVLLRDASSDEDVQTALYKFERLRKERVEFVAKSSRHMGGLLGPDAGALDRAEYSRRTHGYRGAEEALKELDL